MEGSFENNVQSTLLFINSISKRKLAEFIVYQNQAIEGLQKNNSDFVEAFHKINSENLNDKKELKVNEERLSTGLCDSNGIEIFVGDFIQIPVTRNQNVHGLWAIYIIKLQGLIPILSYYKSQKGQMMPEGYMSCLLSDYYDLKLLLQISDTLRLRPDDQPLKVLQGYKS